METGTSKLGEEEAKFRKGELALCFFKGMLYDVKCLNIRKIEQFYEVKVHFMNFGKSYDEYVNEITILKRTPPNLAKKEMLVRYMDKFRTSLKKLNKFRGMSEQRAWSSDNENIDASFQFKSLNLPDDLIQWISFDWIQINEKQRPLATPARISVISVLDDYYSYQLNIVVSSKSIILRDFVIRLEEIFEKTIGKSLLHKSERDEFQRYSNTPSPIYSQHYGSFHLLRLIGWISTHFDEIRPDDENEELFWDHFDDFIKYLMNNQAELFNENDFI